MQIVFISVVLIIASTLAAKITNTERRSWRCRRNNVRRLQRLRTSIYNRIFGCAISRWWYVGADLRDCGYSQEA